jgi:hypothetical protein
MAVTIILARMHGKPLDRWTISISLNATIAIFITAAKSLALLVIGACIAQSKWICFKSSARKLEELDLFDSAARGPLGSLRLLLQVRWHTGLASVGAIVTILALGVDTFAQQVIRLDTRDLRVMDGSATFALSHNYSGGAKWISPSQTAVEGNFFALHNSHSTFDRVQLIIDSKLRRCSHGRCRIPRYLQYNVGAQVYVQLNMCLE